LPHGTLHADAKKPIAATRSASTEVPGANLLRDYKVSPLDTLSITVFAEPDLTRDVKVSQTGYVTFPLLGKVYVAGLMVHEVENRIAALLGKDYIKNPQVSVNVKEYSARRVSVLGEVKKPGSFDIPAEERMSLLQAIARAEGFTNLASTDDVVIKRMDGGKEEKIVVNASELMNSKGEKRDVDLKPGDIVVVPTRFF
jgi:polysaccharide export outer membrane protein